MNPSFEQLTTGIESSITVVDLNMERFEGHYHFHPEIELTWIRASSGKRFVGGNIADYEPDDLVLLGADIPHCWQSMEGSTDNAQALVIQFRSDFAGEAFLLLPETSRIHELLKNANAGISIQGETRRNVILKIQQLLPSEKLPRLLLLVEILDLIANSAEVHFIDPTYSGLSTYTTETERFHQVFGYLIEHYQEQISLETMAGIAHLTPTAFCRYFKGVTRKTLVEVVVELRLNHACQLLRSSEKPVKEICFESGFGNSSYFNKTFKGVTGYSPLQYRSHFRF